MPVIVVTSETEGVGKTGVAAAIARHVAYRGRPVRLLRVAGDGNSAADQGYYASLEFVPGTPTEPVTAASVANPRVGTYVVEAGLEAARPLPSTETVLVARGAAPAALPGGLEVTVAVATAVDLEAPPLPLAIGTVPLVTVPDDRQLAAFSLSEARQLLDAEVLVPGDVADPTCDGIVVAPISADAGQPYLRRFARQAIVCRFDRTDMHLAAIRSDPSCLILTGGHRPSDYLFDAARSQGVPVLLSEVDTEKTVMALENVFAFTRFQGDSKLERLAALLDETALFDVVAADGSPGRS